MDFSQSASLFGQEIKQQIRYQEDHYYRILAEELSRELLWNKRDREEQIPCTNPLYTLQPKPKRLWSKKDLKDNPQRSESMNNTSQQKGICFSVAINTCIHASHVVNRSINNNLFHSTPSLPPNSAFNGSWKSLYPTVIQSITLTNWKQHHILRFYRQYKCTRLNFGSIPGNSASLTASLRKMHS